jgi:hypothetical protein
MTERKTAYNTKVSGQAGGLRSFKHWWVKARPSPTLSVSGQAMRQCNNKTKRQK